MVEFNSDETVEEWRDVIGYEGLYLVSNLGRVKSLQRRKERILRPHPTPNGYLLVILCKNGEKKGKTVHSLVLSSFAGPRTGDLQACHNDGNKLNNALSNLRWDSPRANHADKAVHGTLPTGEANPNSKLDVSQVIEIYRRVHSGELQRAVGQEYGINQPAVSRIKLKQSWKSVLECIGNE